MDERDTSNRGSRTSKRMMMGLAAGLVLALAIVAVLVTTLQTRQNGTAVQGRPGTPTQ